MSLAMDKSRKAVEELKAAILSGKFSSGNFPSIAMIMARFGLARATAVKVRDELKSQRLIVGKVGKGTFITRRAMSRKIGLIVPSIIGSEFFPVVVSETAKVIRENGYTLQFADFQLCASSAGLGDEVMAFVDGRLVTNEGLVLSGPAAGRRRGGGVGPVGALGDHLARHLHESPAGCVA